MNGQNPDREEVITSGIGGHIQVWDSHIGSSDGYCWLHFPCFYDLHVLLLTLLYSQSFQLY